MSINASGNVNWYSMSHILTIHRISKNQYCIKIEIENKIRKLRSYDPYMDIGATQVISLSVFKRTPLTNGHGL